MGQIKVVLIFNEDDERQREAGEYLKTKKRCKTALVTELVQAWMKNGETGAVSRPRQHRHLKRKNSILFLVFLDFPHFFIHSGWQDTLF